MAAPLTVVPWVVRPCVVQLVAPLCAGRTAALRIVRRVGVRTTAAAIDPIIPLPVLPRELQWGSPSVQPRAIARRLTISRHRSSLCQHAVITPIRLAGSGSIG